MDLDREGILEKYNVEIFTVEHNFIEKKRDLIFALMTSHNYVRVFTNISQWDDWYIKKNNKILLSMMDKINNPNPFKANI